MKQSIFTLLILATIVMSCSQKSNSFEISGTVNGAPENTQVTLYTAVGDTLAVTNLVDGKFTVRGAVAEPAEAYLTFGIPYCGVILENENYTADIDFTDKTTFILEGGHLNTMVNKYKYDPKYVATMGEMITLIDENKDLDESDKEAMDAFMEVYQEKNKVLSEISSTYLNGIVDGDAPIIDKFYALKNNNSGADYTLDDRIELVKSYQANNVHLKDMDKYIGDLESYKKSLEMAQTVGVGSDFKEVMAMTNAKEEVKLSDVISKNEYTLLEFWASWCGPCRAEFPHLKEAYSHFNEKGFEIYGISIDDDEDKWLKAEKEEGIPWISVVDYDARNSNAMKAYGVLGIPASFLISKEGKIVATGSEIRGLRLEEKLSELFD